MYWRSRVPGVKYWVNLAMDRVGAPFWRKAFIYTVEELGFRINCIDKQLLNSPNSARNSYFKYVLSTTDRTGVFFSIDDSLNHSVVYWWVTFGEIAGGGWGINNKDGTLKRGSKRQNKFNVQSSNSNIQGFKINPKWLWLGANRFLDLKFSFSV